MNSRDVQNFEGLTIALFTGESEPMLLVACSFEQFGGVFPRVAENLVTKRNWGSRELDGPSASDGFHTSHLQKQRL